MPDLQMRRNLSRRQLEESQLSGRRLNRETSRRLTGRLVPFILIPFATLCLLGGVLANPEAKAATPVAKENSQESSVPGVRPATRPAPQAQTPAPPPRQMPKRQGDITFDDLKFDIEKGAPFERKMLTPEIEALHGKTVKLRGYILPASVFSKQGFNSLCWCETTKSVALDQVRQSTIA